MNFETLMAFFGRHPMLSLGLLGLTLAIAYTEIARLMRGYKAVKPADLTTLMNQQGALVIDLSAITDFEKGHIPGSRNVIPSQFDPQSKLLVNAKQSPVVLVCRSGNASGDAAAKLKKAGFEQVHVLDGGINAWQAAGLPLVKGR